MKAQDQLFYLEIFYKVPNLLKYIYINCFLIFYFNFFFLNVSQISYLNNYQIRFIKNISESSFYI